MVTETTWGNGSKTRFGWTVKPYGIVLDHRKKAAPYSIPWTTFSQVLTQARLMASIKGNQIAAGTNQDNPSPGSLGEWVLGQTLPISGGGRLTPRHLSFIGPIFGRMGLATHTLKRGAIVWHFTFP